MTVGERAAGQGGWVVATGMPPCSQRVAATGAQGSNKVIESGGCFWGQEIQREFTMPPDTIANEFTFRGMSSQRGRGNHQASVKVIVNYNATASAFGFLFAVGTYDNGWVRQPYMSMSGRNYGAFRTTLLADVW